jgi:trehalose 6-phosphate phosphatase
VTVTLSRISGLPHALRDGQQFARHLDGRQPAVFLNYDGTLTPIVARPEDAVISDRMRDAVYGLTARATVCVVSGRDRPPVTRWMGIDGVVAAGSHGFETPSGLSKGIGWASVSPSQLPTSGNKLAGPPLRTLCWSRSRRCSSS